MSGRATLASRDRTLTCTVSPRSLPSSCRVFALIENIEPVRASGHQTDVRERDAIDGRIDTDRPEGSESLPRVRDLDTRLDVALDRRTDQGRELDLRVDIAHMERSHRSARAVEQGDGRTLARILIGGAIREPDRSTGERGRRATRKRLTDRHPRSARSRRPLASHAPALAPAALSTAKMLTSTSTM